ncbi:helix-turn-helix domain-containing protein [Pantoea sp. BAV 3049]|uniref:helix-turn-helix domain-containing protein n=1 Tax=Pantoea sp. BAV 3049 TaxID=2654188 RepID=UPI00131E802F|nr:helix-turn-helix domain-containing protein [Pantoea sp. BAV 3049]
MKTTFDLPRRITSRRVELGLSQQQVADLIKRSYVSVYRWEAGETEPKGKNLLALANALKCSPAWLLYGDEELTPIAATAIPSEMDDRQKRLLELFEALPESEKQACILDLEARVENNDRLFEELLKIRKKISKKKTS